MTPKKTLLKIEHRTLKSLNYFSFQILKLIKEDDEGHGESQDDASTPGSTQALQAQQATTDATSGKF